MKNQVFLITCEHAGNQVPFVYKGLFKDAEDTLSSHEGWDPGALNLASNIAEHLHCEMYTYDYTRLLIEVNSSIWNYRLFSRFTRDISAHDRMYLINTYYYPYRNAVEDRIRRYVSKGKQVVHLSVHTFTPDFFGQLRDVEIGLLFDYYRDSESAFCADFKRQLQEQLTCDIRDNEPYKGSDDGFTTYLRGEFSDSQYLGVELEVSQKIVSDRCLQTKIVDSLVSLSSMPHAGPLD